jgi:hypothetical protein
MMSYRKLAPGVCYGLAICQYGVDDSTGGICSRDYFPKGSGDAQQHVADGAAHERESKEDARTRHLIAFFYLCSTVMYGPWSCFKTCYLQNSASIQNHGWMWTCKLPC